MSSLAQHAMSRALEAAARRQEAPPPEYWEPDWEAYVDRCVLPQVGNYHQLFIDIAPRSDAQAAMCDLMQLAETLDKPMTRAQRRDHDDRCCLAILSLRDAFASAGLDMARNHEDVCAEDDHE